ncbi:MAG: glycosyltransferase [Emticicia sp.]|uniref:glycosyltransferase n=1 Tax=Emticicia sp. TaxID=1930953 RepID=UPI003BA42F20
MNKRALIVPASIRSHVIPSLFLADLLSENGYEVHYAVTTEILKEIVEKNAYKAYIISSFKVAIGAEGRVITEIKKDKVSFLRLVKAYRTNEVYEYRKGEYNKLIELIKPSVIILDIFNSTDFISLYHKHHEIKICLFNPMPSTYRVGDYPIVSEGFLIKSNRKNENQELNKFSIKGFLKYPKSTILAYLAQNQVKKLIMNNEIPEKYKIVPNSFTMSFDNVPELLLAPLEFEFAPEVRKSYQYYLGLCHREKRKDTELDENFEKGWQKIIKEKQGSDEISPKKIIYCSFGTYYEGPDRKLLDFLNTIIDAVSSIPNSFLIISVNRFVIEFIESNRKDIPNVIFFSRVPQLQVLQICDLFITHGGFGSIKESIHYEVPMLVYPLDMHYDQNGNAFKVEYFGIGLRGVFGFERLNELKIKINQLLDDEAFKNKIKTFKEINVKNYSPEILKQTLNEIGL